MDSDSEKIKHDLFDLYEVFYLMGKNDKISLFLNAEVLKTIKYKPEEVKKALSIEDGVAGIKKQKISLEILPIESREQALEFFAENLECYFDSSNTETEKNHILKKVTMEDLKYLYQLIFGIPVTNKCKKENILYKIKEFCENEKRTEDLIKNLY